MSKNQALTELGRVSFTVGIVGNMDIGVSPGEQERLVNKVKSALKFLANGDAPTAGESAGCGFRANLMDESAAGLEAWKGLGPTPIVVLSSLAPGADTIGARAAIELRNEGYSVRLRCPLPFPKEVYPTASTFANGGTCDFEDTINLVADVDVFPVLLRKHPVSGVAENDASWWSSAAQDRWWADQEAETADHTKVRHIRYRAAGEYIAAYCDVLIALWDDRESADKPSDTAYAVDAKRRGLENSALPVTTGFTWADNGPIWHLQVAREKFSTGSTKNHPYLGKWRILHPYELDPGPESAPGKPAQQEPRPEHFLDHPSYQWDFLRQRAPQESDNERRLRIWQETGNSVLIKIGWNFRKFTEGTCGEGLGKKIGIARWQEDVNSKADKEVRKWSIADEDERFAKPREAMTRARRAAADIAAALDDDRKESLVRLFGFAFLSAILVHCFAHYHPDTRYDHETKWPYLVQSFLLAGAVIAALFGLVNFSRYHASRGEARRYDARALAEGLRVQIAWAVAGIHRSAAANYMQRQRGELAWIRSAMSSLAIPYHQWLESWHAESQSGKLARLRQVKTLWVTEQAEYFVKSQKKRASALHFWHVLGKLTALAGGVLLVITAVLLLGYECFGQSWVKQGLIGLGIFATLGTAGRFHQHWLAVKQGWVGVKTNAETRNPMDPNRPRDLPLWKGFMSDGGASMEYPLVHCLLGSWGFPCRLEVHAPEHPPADAGEIIANDKRGFGRLVFFACWPALVLFLLAWLLGQIPILPQLKEGCIILAATASVGGALMVAWAEKQLYSEEAYHFNSMAVIFRAASERLGHLIQLAEQGKNADKSINEAQELLFLVGKEALNENAEWLILHRSRPMEPVLGG